MSLLSVPALVVDTILVEGGFNANQAVQLLSTCKRLRAHMPHLTAFWQRLAQRYPIVARHDHGSSLAESVGWLRIEMFSAKWATPGFHRCCPPDSSTLLSQPDQVMAIGVTSDSQILDIVANLPHKSAAIVCGAPDSQLSELALINGICAVLQSRNIKLLGVFVSAQLPTTQQPADSVSLVLPRALASTRFSRHDGKSLIFATPDALDAISPQQKLHVNQFLRASAATFGGTQTFLRDLHRTADLHSYMRAWSHESIMQQVAFRVFETSRAPPDDSRTLLVTLKHGGLHWPVWAMMDS